MTIFTICVYVFNPFNTVRKVRNNITFCAKMRFVRILDFKLCYHSQFLFSEKMYRLLCFIVLSGNCVNLEPTDVLGKSFDLRKTEIRGDHHGGSTIFKPFSKNSSCYSTYSSPREEETETYYENNEDYFKKLDSNSGIAAELVGPVTMGATLDVHTTGMSSGSVNVKGISLIKESQDYITILDEACYKGSKVELTDDVMKSFKDLPLKVTNPELESSWDKYHNFLELYGTHIIINIRVGVKITHYTFSQSENRYTNEQMKIRLCGDFVGFSPAGKVEAGACTGITSEQYKKTINLKVTSKSELRGGSEAARIAFWSNVYPDRFIKALTEPGRIHSIIDCKYFALWDILIAKFKGDPEQYPKAQNLKQYYEGYLNFGCQLIKQGKTMLRWFRHSNHSTKENPKYECVLKRQGCHSNEDCNSDSLCRGDTCVEHVSPPPGKKSAEAKIREKPDGKKDEGINKSCDADRSCNFKWSTDIVIWKNHKTVGYLSPVNPTDNPTESVSRTGKASFISICLSFALFYLAF